MNQTQSKPAFLTLRILLAFLLLAALLVGLYLVAYRSYPAVAEWERPGDHETFVYEGRIYRLIGQRGGRGYNAKNYPLGSQIGRVKDDGLVADAATDTLESGDDADPTLVRDHAYVLYTVEDKEHILLLLETDGEYSIYAPEVAVWASPADRTSLTYAGHIYDFIGEQGDEGLAKDDFAQGETLGLVRNDHHLLLSSETETDLTEEEDGSTEEDLLAHRYMLSRVEHYKNLLMVEDVDGSIRIYCRENSQNPLE